MLFASHLLEFVGVLKHINVVGRERMIAHLVDRRQPILEHVFGRPRTLRLRPMMDPSPAWVIRVVRLARFGRPPRQAGVFGSRPSECLAAALEERPAAIG
jgi:hypothetical protein